MLTTNTEHGIVTITLSRPERLNALTFEMLDQLRELLEAYGGERATRAIVLTGSGRAFSSGADLQELDKHRDDLGRYISDAVSQSVEPLCEVLAASPVPVVAAVNGPCVGGGVGLALLADVTIAARSAYFLVPQVSALNLVPDVGATWALPRLVGRARALGMSLLGEQVSGEQAAQWGLIWRCVEDDDCVGIAQEIAHRLAASPAAAVATRQLIDTGGDADLGEQLAHEAQRQGELAHRPTAEAAIAKFAEQN